MVIWKSLSVAGGRHLMRSTRSKVLASGQDVVGLLLPWAKSFRLLPTVTIGYGFQPFLSIKIFFRYVKKNV